MKRLLGATILAMMAVLMLAPAAMGQTPSCADDDGYCVSYGPFPTEQPASVPGVPDYNGPLASDIPATQVTPDGVQYDVITAPTQSASEAPVGQFPAICSADTIDQFPEGTVCVEGGGFNLPEEVPTATPAATTTALPATGGPSLVLIAGVLLVGAGLVLRRR